MSKPKGDGFISRREALALGMTGAGVGIASMLGAGLVRAQRPRAFPPPRNPQFGDSPSWVTELRKSDPTAMPTFKATGHRTTAAVSATPVLLSVTMASLYSIR